MKKKFGIVAIVIAVAVGIVLAFKSKFVREKVGGMLNK